MSTREPKPGDVYVPLFESDITEAKAEGLDVDVYHIVDVEYKWDEGEGWCITAKGSDPDEEPVGFDCQWSELYQTWCYGV